MMEAFWTLLSLFAVLSAIEELWDAYKDKRALGALANGRLRVAKDHILEAWLGIVIYLFSFSAGFMAFAYRLEWIGLHIRLAWIPYALIAMLVVLVSRQQIRRRARKAALRAPDEAENARAREAIYDTQAKVTEIQQRGLLDQPLEQTDRAEGHTHRGVLEDAAEADRAERKEERRLDREERAVEREADREERRAEDEQRDS